jgi:hypothetical protein
MKWFVRNSGPEVILHHMIYKNTDGEVVMDTYTARPTVEDPFDDSPRYRLKVRLWCHTTDLTCGPWPLLRVNRYLLNEARLRGYEG